MLLSFIIPVRNEEKEIKCCIQSIKSSVNLKDCEIIVIDNGSSDNSAKFAKEAGTIVLQKNKCFVGAVRNFGAQRAHGKVLCFIDADCAITKRWYDQIRIYVDDLLTKKIGIVGANYTLAPDSNLIQKSWSSHHFQNFVGPREMVPAGNMIISKELFTSIGGFNENITSGEDYELCGRVKNIGLLTLHDYRLECIHYGNPSSLKQFYHRERWHGRGMIIDLQNPLRSRPIMMSILYVATYIVFVFLTILLFVDFRLICLIPYLLLPAIIPPVLFSFFRLYKNSRLEYFPVLCILYIIYSFARSLSLIEIFWFLLKKKIIQPAKGRN